ncbi:hypothetical protein C2S53_015828 [Perilla frutescens var. hirtella]|uniref:Uncharacterized protein n=1 Tax=Perilla frutescens var. hirtella TaxID=608512 RepID=A0AAD4IUK3_PERFH|nr:hypothetical protein C2S53_015828 [Perilla frutescens var. hirtella]
MVNHLNLNPCLQCRLGGSDRPFTVSYLINSCGLPKNDAVAASKKLLIESRENPDAVLELLADYGFTNLHISKLVSRWPFVLQYRANETLLPKLKFFCSIGVPDAVSTMSEWTLKSKRDVYGRCGWSESEVAAAFLRSPNCMTLSEKKITATLDFLVNELGLKAGDVARRPLLLTLNLDKRMRLRWSVAKILIAKGLLKESTSVAGLMVSSEVCY